MAFTIQLDIDITEHPDASDEDKAIASIRRFYDIESLERLELIVSNFGRVAASLVEGEKLGISEG